jgi:tetratricopeptide (TPR) repeat protein
LPGQVLIARPYRSVREGKVPDQIIGSALEGAAELFFILSDTGDNSPGSRIRNQIYLQIATYLAPNGDVYGMALGQSFEATGQIQRAIDIYNTIEAGSEFQHTAEIRKAQGLARLERTDEAIAVIKALIASEPQNLESIQSLADLYRTEKRWAEAIAAYDIAATMAKGNNAESWQILFSRGVSHERNKNWAAAEADLKQSLAMMPAARPGTRGAAQRAQVMNYLAYSWVDRDENIPQAFDMLKEAVELTAGRDGYIVDSLGWAYYRRGMYEQAVVELEKAVALKPGDPVINDHLGDAYHKVGRKLEATFKWNHALALKPDDDVKKRLQEKIAGGPVDVPKVNAAGDSKNGG